MILFFICSLVSRRLFFNLGDLGGLAFQTCLCASLSGIGLVDKGLFLHLDGLHFVDGFEEHTLVLELVTLRQHVEGMVDMFVDLLRISHLLEETTKNTDTAHPNDLERETGIGCTSALTSTWVCARGDE
jgi:hypothetical protein